ncbi:MAG: ABC transporter permease [Thermoflexales bacterium]|nr:ABC transporter permease [Thermoflexales bacterium]
MRLFSLIRLAARRLVTQRALSACLLLGMTVAVAIASAIPAFVAAAQTRVLRRELADRAAADHAVGANPGITPAPLALRFSYLSLGRALLSYDETRQLDAFMAERIAPNLALPKLRTIRYASTDPWAVFPGAETWKRYPTQDSAPMVYAAFQNMTDFLDHIDIEAGRLPAGFPGARAVAEVPAGEIEVMIGAALSAKTGLQPGDMISMTRKDSVTTAVDLRNSGQIVRETTLLARITGIWSPRNGNDTFWIVRPDVVEQDITLSPTMLTERVSGLVERQFSLMMWTYELDERALTIDNVADVVGNAEALGRETYARNPQLTLNQLDVIASLRNYLKRSQELVVLMALFCAPLFAVVLSFVSLVAGMVTRQQEGELAILRSRGASSFDVVLLYVLQGGLLAGLALLIGIPLSFGVASLLASAVTFLRFAAEPAWVTALPPLSLRLATLAAALGAAATLVPAVSAARHTILGFGADRARSLRRPFWQRAWLDVLLLLPCLYATWQLRQTGTIDLLGASGVQADPFKDPVRFLLPILTLTAAGLAASRLIPRLFAALAALISRPKPLTPFFFALRDLSRSPGDYTGALLLLVFTLGIAAYGASLARTLDEHLIDTVYLNNGGDLRLVEIGQSNKPPLEYGVPGQASSDNEPEYFFFEPPALHLQIEGVQDYARAGRIPVRPRLPSPLPNGDKSAMLAIDRLPFARIAARGLRDDYSRSSMMATLNALGQRPDALLVEQRFLDKYGLRVGQPLVVELADYRAPAIITYTIVGAFDVFPLIAGSEAAFDKGSFFVSNADFTYRRMGTELSYDVIVQTTPGTSAERVLLEGRELGLNIMAVSDARTTILGEQQRPERQGLFGALTAGFVFMTALTVLGFAIYALLSFRRRAIELGVLRALGLSETQTAAYVIGAQAALTLLGALVGTGLGVLLSLVYVPTMQANSRMIAAVPPFLTRMAWENVAVLYLALAAALGAVIVGSLAFLRRMRAFEAIKLGAT